MAETAPDFELFTPPAPRQLTAKASATQAEVIRRNVGKQATVGGQAVMIVSVADVPDENDQYTITAMPLLDWLLSTQKE